MTRFEKLTLFIESLVLVTASVAGYFTFRQVQVGWSTLEGTTRAWVVTGEDVTMTCPKVGESPKVAYFWVNGGARPAVNVKTHSWILLVNQGPKFRFPENPPSEWYPDVQSASYERSVSVIAKDQKQWDSLASAEPLNAEQYRHMVQGDWTLFVYGKADYDDGFGATRHTKWCRRWVPEEGCGVYHFTWCGTHNSVD